MISRIALKKTFLLIVVLGFYNLSAEQINTETQATVIEKISCDLVLLDQVEAEIHGIESTEIVTSGIINRRGFDGTAHTLENVVDERLFDKLGEKFKINVTDEDINRYLQKMGLNEQQVKGIYQNWGYPSKEVFYEDLKKMYRGSSAMQTELESLLVVTEDEIIAYYGANPITEEAIYTLETAFVELGDQDSKHLEEELNAYAAGKRRFEGLLWESPFTVKESEVSKANDFILNMKTSDIHVKKIQDGFVIYRLKNKRPTFTVPLEERRKEIITALKQEKFPSALDSLRARLRQDALVYYPTQEYSAPCSTSELSQPVI